MAFQPIVSISNRKVFAYESLVRGPQGESAYSVLSQVNETNRYAFDQNCRIKAIQLASSLGIADRGSRLSVNFLPGAVYSPAACIQQTLRTARETSFPLSALIFEITEAEEVRDPAHIEAIVREYQKHGFSMALDDFGAGFSGLNLLSELNVEFLKLDARLIRNIERRPRAEAILKSLVDMARAVGTQIIGECVETLEEFAVLHNNGIDLMQGYLFAKPQFEALPDISWVDNVY